MNTLRDLGACSLNLEITLVLNEGFTVLSIWTVIQAYLNEPAMIDIPR